MGSLQTQKCTHRLIHKNIILLKINEGETIEAGDVLQMHDAHLKLSKGEPFAVLLDATTHFTVTTEARTMIAGSFRGQLVASAFVLNSLATRLTGNFFIRFHKPVNPTRLFNDEKKAFDWLRAQMDKKVLAEG